MLNTTTKGMREKGATEFLCLRLNREGKAVPHMHTGYQVASFFTTERRNFRGSVIYGWEVYHIHSGMKVTNRIFNQHLRAQAFMRTLADLTPDVDWTFKPDYQTYKIGDLNDVLGLGHAVRQALKEADNAYFPVIPGGSSQATSI